MNRDLKSEFPAIGSYRAYLNTASNGLTPRVTIEEVERLLGELSSRVELDDYFWSAKRLAHRVVAGFIGAEEGEVAFTGQTSDCLKKAISMLKPSHDARIYSLDDEFPTVSSIVESICTQTSCKPVVVEALGKESVEERIESAIRGDRPRQGIILVSSVNWVHGRKLDLKYLSEIAEEYGVWLVVDGVQHVGVLGFSVDRVKVDILCCGGEKWLLTPFFGVGFMYVKRDHIPRLDLSPYGILNRVEPSSGWSSYWPDPSKDPWTLPPILETAEKYEAGGGPAYIPIFALAKSIEFLKGIELESIETYVLKLRRVLIDELSSRGYRVLSNMNEEHGSPIVLFTTGSGYEKELRIVSFLRERGVAVSYRGVKGFGGIRVSPHVYNNVEDLEVFLQELDSALKTT